MKNFKTLLLSSCAVLFSITTNAQTLTITTGDESMSDLVKGSEHENFTLGTNRYFITKFFKDAVMHYDMLCYDGNNQVACDNELKIQGGVFNNTFSIDNVLPLGDKVYAMVEHLDKAAGKNTLLARVFEKPGTIATTETEVMSIPFEKIMNSGFNYSASSPNKNIVVVVGEMPFVKEQPATFKIALFDKDMKKTGESQITLPGENKKNKSMNVMVTNSGVVYLLKKSMTGKGEIALSVYQYYPAKGADVKEYVIEVTAPDQIYSYTTELNSNGELIVAGTYYKRQTMTVGDTKATGVFFFTNTGLSEKNFKTFALDKPVELLTARKILINDNTIFLTAEQYKEERESQPAGNMSFDYNYNYTHKSEFVIGMTNDGNKKFQMELSRDMTARNLDKQFYSGCFLCNGKLTVVYNDNTKKYIPNDYYFGYQIPVVVQITNDGLMQSPVILKDKLKLPEGYMLYPSLSVQDSNNQIALLMGHSQARKIVVIKVD